MQYPGLEPVVRPKLQVTQPNPFISNGRNKSYLIQHFNSTHNLETRPALNTLQGFTASLVQRCIHWRELIGWIKQRALFIKDHIFCFLKWQIQFWVNVPPDPNRVEPESVSNKCEVVYIKEKNLDDYISKMEPNWRGNIYYQ